MCERYPPSISVVKDAYILAKISGIVIKKPAQFID
jgi:hypothetical protein